MEHASPYGKDPGEKVPGEKRKIGTAAERAWQQRKRAGLQPALAAANCDVDEELPKARPAPAPRMRASDWILSSVVLAEAAALTYAKMRGRYSRLKI